MATHIIIHTDGGGGHVSKDFIGAWAFVARVPWTSTPIERFGVEWDTTNNKMEMMAVIKALEHFRTGIPMTIISDSQYVIFGATQWRFAWVKNGWVNGEGKPVKNRDLWERMIPLLIRHRLTFQHVKGHTGNVDNERCDKLCTEAIKRVWAQRQEQSLEA
jgi:ribonuclease HI